MTRTEPVGPPRRARGGPAGSGDVLTRRALNRATLDRQLLLTRSALSVTDTLEHLVGLQAQAPAPPYFGLWTRLKGFGPDELAALLLDRRAVRMVVMRGTIHLVTAPDALALRPLTQTIMDSHVRRHVTIKAELAGMDLKTVAAAARAILAERPLKVAELAARLQQRWPDRDGAALALAARFMLPLVQVPPRGIWGSSGPLAVTTVEAWLGQPLRTHPSVDDLVMRYLAAFGPASVADAQTWSGLTRLREVVERLRPRLRSFRDEHGRELFDLPDAPRPGPDVPAPPRFLPEFDNLVLSHADRTRIIADEHRQPFVSRNGMVPASLLVDGFARATWKIERRPGAATLVIAAFTPLSRQDTAAVTREGAALLRFAADGASHDVRFA